MLIEGRRDAVVRNHGQAGFFFFFFFKWKKNRSLTKTLQNVTIAEDLAFIGQEIFVSDLADWNKPIISFDLFYEPISSLVIRSANQFKPYEVHIVKIYCKWQQGIVGKIQKGIINIDEVFALIIKKKNHIYGQVHRVTSHSMLPWD